MAYLDYFLQVFPGFLQCVHGEPCVWVVSDIEALNLLIQGRQLVKIGLSGAQWSLELIVGLSQELKTNKDKSYWLKSVWAALSEALNWSWVSLSNWNQTQTNVIYMYFKYCLLIAGEIVPRRNRTQENSNPYWMGTISPEISYPGYDFSRDFVPKVRFLQRYRTLRTKFYHYNILINLYRQYRYTCIFRSFKTTWAGLNVFFLYLLNRDAFRSDINFFPCFI